MNLLSPLLLSVLMELMPGVRVSCPPPREFPAPVERWRLPLGEIGPEIPRDFMLAWIEHESDGRPGARSKLDERGLFQVHPSSIRSLGLTYSEWSDSLGETDDAARVQLAVGVRHVRQHMRRAQKILSKSDVSWDAESFWRFVKLGHALPIAQTRTMAFFHAEHGRGPAGWDEFAAAARAYARRGRYGGWSRVVLRVVDVSEHIGEMPQCVVSFGGAP